MVMRLIRATNTDIRRVWLDSELTLVQAAAAVGMSKDALQGRAAALGLGHRRMGRREAIRPHQEAEFRRMWAAGVGARIIGTAFGCSYCAVINTATRLGLPMRGAGYRPKMTLGQFRETELGRAMRVHAALENQALREACA